MPRKICLIPTCESSPEDKKFIRVPRNEKLREIWKFFLLPYAPQLSNITPGSFRSLYVCENHFEKKYLCGSISYKQKFFPTLFTDNEISTGISTQSLVEQCQDHLFSVNRNHAKGSLNDHNYAKNWYFKIQTETRKSEKLINYLIISRVISKPPDTIKSQS